MSARANRSGSGGLGTAAHSLAGTILGVALLVTLSTGAARAELRSDWDLPLRLLGVLAALLGVVGMLRADAARETGRSVRRGFGSLAAAGALLAIGGWLVAAGLVLFAVVVLPFDGGRADANAIADPDADPDVLETPRP